MAQTDTERRADLLKAAKRSFESIGAELRDSIAGSASAAQLITSRSAQWSIRLGPAELIATVVSSTPSDPWHWQAPAFEVIAHASLALTIPETYHGYVGRSHSLWFCDAIEAGNYRWYETSFMISPMMSRSSKRDPFALEPGEEAAKALWNGMAEFQTAWPFTPLTVGDLDEFIDRWAGWLALASSGNLQHPMSMPERQANNWRRS